MIGEARFATYQERVKKACCVIRYCLIASLLLAVLLFLIGRNSVTFYLYINYHFNFRNLGPESFAHIPIIFLVLFWGSTSRLFIGMNYKIAKFFREESKKDFVQRQARYSCGTWFSWSVVCIVFILIALLSICHSPDWFGWVLYLYYAGFVFVINHYFYNCFLGFFKKLEKFAEE